MSVSSLRPERSASANSATPASCAGCILSQKVVLSNIRKLELSNLEQIFIFHRLLSIPFITVLSIHYSTDRGCIFFSRNSLYYSSKKGVANMFVLAVVVVILLLALAGSDLFVSQYSPDELSSMGVQEQ